MSIRPADLPDYERPPVNEVVIGLSFGQFKLSQAHIGLFWSRIRDRYPDLREVPPLQSVIERFDNEATGASIEMVDLPPTRRSWFIGTEPQWLLQVQDDRVLHNWRRVTDTDRYPHFEACLERFQSAWSALQTMIAKEKLGEPDVVQLEVSYINHIAVGEGWNDLADVGLVLPDLQWRPTPRWLPTAETFAWQTTFRLPLERARLHIKVQHALRNRDRKPVLVCELTVRGMPAQLTMQEWMLGARAACVNAFADVIASDLQKSVWGRR